MLKTIDKYIQCLSGISQLSCEAWWNELWGRNYCERSSIEFSSPSCSVTTQKCWSQVESNVTWDQICVAVAHTYLLDIIQSRVISAELWYLDYLGMKKMRRDTRANANISDTSSGTPLTQFLWLGLQVANVPVRLWWTACNRLTVTWPDNRYRRVTGTHGIYHQPRWYTKMIYIYKYIYRYKYVYKYRLNTAGKKVKTNDRETAKCVHIAACYLNIKIIIPKMS